MEDIMAGVQLENIMETNSAVIQKVKGVENKITEIQQQLKDMQTANKETQKQLKNLNLALQQLVGSQTKPEGSLVIQAEQTRRKQHGCRMQWTR